jgi:transaldolase
MPDGTLNAFADHGRAETVLLDDGGDSDEVIGEFARAGISVETLAEQLQAEGTTSFVSAWNELMAGIASERAALKQALTR